MTAYLEIEDALRAVDRYGFRIRGIGLLASALASPATTVRGVEAYRQLATKAAGLMESAARFHPLIDGNKRTAWTLMVLMLWINGYWHDFTTVLRQGGLRPPLFQPWSCACTENASASTASIPEALAFSSTGPLFHTVNRHNPEETKR